MERSHASFVFGKRENRARRTIIECKRKKKKERKIKKEEKIDEKKKHEKKKKRKILSAEW